MAYVKSKKELPGALGFVALLAIFIIPTLMLGMLLYTCINNIFDTGRIGLKPYPPITEDITQSP